MKPPFVLETDSGNTVLQDFSETKQNKTNTCFCRNIQAGKQTTNTKQGRLENWNIDPRFLRLYGLTKAVATLHKAGATHGKPQGLTEAQATLNKTEAEATHGKPNGLTETEATHGKPTAALSSKYRFRRCSLRIRDVNEIG